MSRRSLGLAELAAKYDTMLLVDEAHATGVFGETGSGLCSALGLHDPNHIRIGTLSKALGTGGGFVCGRQSLIDYLANAARSYVFSTAQPAATSAAALAALEIVTSEPHRRRELLARAANLRSAASGTRLEHRPLRKPDHPALHRRPRPHDAAGRKAPRSGLLHPRHPPTVGPRRRIIAASEPLLPSHAGDDRSTFGNSRSGNTASTQ